MIHRVEHKDKKMKKFVEVRMKCSIKDVYFSALFEENGMHFHYVENKVEKSDINNKDCVVARDQPLKLFPSRSKNTLPSMRQKIPSIEKSNESGKQSLNDTNVISKISNENLIWVGFSCLCGHSAKSELDAHFMQCGSCNDLVCPAKSYVAKCGGKVFVCSDSCGVASEVGGSIDSVSVLKSSGGQNSIRESSNLQSGKEPSKLRLLGRQFRLPSK